MKKRLLLLLCLIATARSAAWADIASGTFKNGGTWKISDAGELYVDAVTVPDYDMTSYKRDYYDDEDCDLDGIFYPRPINTSPWYGFMPRIKKIRLSNKVTTVGEFAFAGLRMVSQVVVEGSGLTLKDWSFYGCFRLVDFPFSNGEVSHIGVQAFWHCGFFRPLVLNGVSSIDSNAFEQCFHLWRDSKSSIPSIVIKGNQYPTVGKMNDYSKGYSEWGVRLNETDQVHVRVAQGSKFIVVNNCGREGTFSSNGVGEVSIGGENWRFVGGTLFIIDKMDSYYASPTQAPWYNFRGRVTRIIANYYVRDVTANAFKDFTALRTVELPGCSTIGDNAFNGCVQLYRVTGLDKVKTIGEGAFASTAIAVADLGGATSIGSNAFDNVGALSQLILGDGVDNIGSYAFRNTLQSQAASCWIKAFGSAPTAASNAFEGVKTKQLIVTGSAASSYNKAPWNQFTLSPITDFPISESDYYCSWTLTGDGTLTVDGGQSSVMKNYTKPEEQPWYLYRDYIKKIVVTSTVSHIGDYAFAFGTEGESRVTEIEIPTAFHVGNHAFENNDKLRSVSANNIDHIGDYAFAGCSEIERYEFGDHLQSIGKNAFDGCKNVDVMALTAANPPDVTAETFKGMGASAGSQGARRKAAGTGQKSVTLDVPDEYLTKYLANPYWRLFSFYAGEYGSIVDSGNFGDGLWILYDNGTMVVSADKGPGNSYAEGSAQALGFGTTSDPRSVINLTKRVEFMGNITHLGWGFQHFPNLESVQLCPSIMRLDDTFESCPKLTAINLENVDTIGDWTFARSGVQNISLPRASYIGRGAFYKCKELQTVSLGTSCEIKEQAFFYCDKMTDINLADAHLDGAHECFSSCYKLKNVTFSGKYLPSRIFSNCFALERIDLGTRVDSICFDAFDGCSALNTVYCANPTPPAMPWGKRKIGEEYYDAQAFYGRNLKNIHLYLPAGFQFPYSKADVWKGMTFETDLSYTEDLLPTGGAVGEDGTWYIDTDGTLTLDFEGGSSSVNIGGSNIGWHDLLASWMPFLTKVVVSDRVNYVPYHMAGEHDPAWSAGVESVELGASVKTLQDQSLNYSGIKDVYCYAESCPSCSRTAFNWDAIAANNATLHVVTSQGVLERYQNSQTWSKFPNIVADLTSRMPAGIFSVTNPESLVMWFRVTDEAAKSCETYHNDVVGKAIEYNSYGHYEKITVPATVTYNGDTYKVTGIGDNSFYGCTNVDTFILPESLERIGVNAFNYCFGVHEFTLPASVQYIGEYAFEMWTNIERFTVNGTTPPTVDENFMNTYWDPDLRPKPTLLVPDGCRDAWNVEPWNKWFNVVDPFNKGVLTYKVIPGASFYDYYQNDEEYMCIEGLKALGVITYENEMVGKEWDELIWDWNEIWGDVYYNKDGKKLFYLDDESRIQIFDGVSSADNIYYEFKEEDYETMMYTTGRNVDLYKGAAIVFPESNVQTDIYFTATNSDGIDITYRVIDLGKKTCEVKADPNGYSGNAVATDVSEVKVPYLADGYVVTGIAADAFNSLSSLQNVTLPLSIRTIGANAFGYCENVVSVYMDCAVPPMLLDQDGFLTDENNYAFENIGVPAGTGIGGAILYVPSGSEELYNVYPWNYWFSMGIAPDPDGIASPKSSPERKDFNWFDLSGRKLAGMPTMPGLYINGGKKIVIK